MRLKYPIFLLIISTVGFRSWALPDNSTVCGLDFTTYPYEPVGECLGNEDEELTVWDHVQTTRCCQSSLNSLTQALALSASENLRIFLTNSQWQKCELHIDTQSAVSTSSCGYDHLYQGNGKCSELTLSSFKVDYGDRYASTSEGCSQFSTPSFDAQCSNCTQGMSRMIEHVINDLQVEGKDEEEQICSIASVIAIASSRVRNATWIKDFYRCLPAMDIKDEGYLKIKRSIAEPVFVTLLAILGMIFLIVLAKFVIKRRNNKPTEEKVVSTYSGLYTFSKQEIERAINYGNSKVCLGSGSAGRVYQGVLPSGQLVAIKHIYKTAMSGSFTREVEGLSRVRHPNLVTLFGFCVAEGEQYLVYEYCAKGNLAQNLLRSDSVLPWDKRVKILRDCALALRFLHTMPDGCIVHRDIKLTNILLTENMEPKLSDFGLAKLIGMEETRVFTDVRGTIGYMDPEYMTNAKLSCSSDIYSFGIVTLQLLSGRKVIEFDIDARDTLTKKAKDVAMKKRSLQDFVDPRLKGELNLRDFESILHVAVLCVAYSSKGRPTINDVLEELNKAWRNTTSNMPALAKREKYKSSSGPQSMEAIEI